MDLRRIIIVLGVLMQLGFSYIALAGDLRTNIPNFWAAIFPLFIVYLIAIWVVKRSEHEEKALFSIVIFAVIFRLTLIFTTPSLSDDIYRYLWDGRTQLNGINPYKYPPSAQEVAHLRDEYYPYINQKHISTIYPPLSQALFLLSYFVSPTITGMKFVFVLFDLLTIGILLLLLRRLGLNLNYSIVYAWSPLVIVETASSGHNEALAVFLLLLAIYLIDKKSDMWSFGVLSLSFLSKFLAFILLPFFVVKARKKWALFLFPLMAVIGYLPYADAGKRLLYGLGVYTLKWRFNDSLFSLIYHYAGSLDLSKRIAAGVFIVYMAYLVLRQVDPIKAGFHLVGLTLVLTTTLHPWYLIWMVPFLCFYHSGAWILLSGSILLSYQVHTNYANRGVWDTSDWVVWAEYVPFYSLLVSSIINSIYTRYKYKLR